MSTRRSRSLSRCLGDHGEGHGEVDVRTWRLCWLLGAGFEAALAEELAGTPAVDLHALLGLVDRGCPPALAARILAPCPAPGRAS